MKRLGQVVLGGLCLIGVASCSGQAPTVPDAASPASVISEVRIAGLSSSSLQPGQTVQLQVEVVLSGGLVKVCTDPTWSVDDDRVADVSASGLLKTGITGYVRVTGTCQGAEAVRELKVAARSPYSWVIVAHDAEVQTEFGIPARIELLDGPDAGRVFGSGSVFTSQVTGLHWPVRARFSAEGFATTEVVLAESTGERRNPTSPLFDFWVPMTFTPGPNTDTYVRSMTKAESEISHAFTMPREGSVRVQTWWSVDYNDRLTTRLWCDGQDLDGVTQLFGSSGAGFTHHATPAGHCEVRIRQHKWDAFTHYRVAITYPH